MEKEFIRVRSVRDVTLSLALLIIGVVLVILPTSVSVNIFGCCLAVPGALLLLFMKTDYKDAVTGERFSRIIKYFPASRKAEIMAALKGNPSDISWENLNSANDGLMIDMYNSKSEDKVCLRVMEFIPYSYVPCSDWFLFSADKVSRLMK